jgi:hypothetical protein
MKIMLLFSLQKVGKRVNLPYSVPGVVTVSRNYQTVIAQFSNTVNIQYDGWTARIFVSEMYSNHLTGMCGNCNGGCADDLMTADGKNVGKLPNYASLIGNSYVVQNDPETNDNR